MVPPTLRTSEPGSFARRTLAVRVPAILEDARRYVGGVATDVDARLDALALELASGTLTPLHEAAPDRPVWDAACAPHTGRSWLDLPWFFAEAFFYRRLLEATGYFQSGVLAGVDPFAALKATELARRTPELVAHVLASTRPAGPERLHALLLASLWGNRADLSYDVARQLGSAAGERTDLIVDDSDSLVRFVHGRDLGSMVVILDNAGSELALDLLLVEALLEDAGVRRVTLHAKNQPMFVSDALVSDVSAALEAFDHASECRALAERLRGALRNGRLRIDAPAFYSTSAMFTDRPPELTAELARADLCIVKGDANYRRLCSDAHWLPTTPFADVVHGFPCAVAALRTLKAELVVGLQPGQAERIASEDPEWLVNGRRGVIQARLT